jgi:hypothetical protein
LHQAETAQDTKVSSVGALIRTEAGRLVVNRNEFHKRLKRELDAYLTELGDPKEAQLRVNFRRKMNYIASERCNRSILGETRAL